MEYRKKPVVIEAFRYGMDSRPDWFNDKVTSNDIITYVGTDIKDSSEYYCEIKTLEGVMRGNCRDYIIKGVQGEVYPCKPDIFEMTYELASTSSQTENKGLDWLVSHWKKLKSEGEKMNWEQIIQITELAKDVPSSQTEISDEEIEALALTFAEEESYGKLSGDLWRGYVFGAKRMRDQLKQRQ